MIERVCLIGRFAVAIVTITLAITVRGQDKDALIRFVNNTYQDLNEPIASSSDLLGARATSVSFGESTFGDGTCGCDDSCCCCPVWTVSADFLYLKHESSDSQTLLADAAGNELLNATDLDFDFESGFRVDLIHHNILNTGWDFEYLFFSIDDWNATAAFPVGAAAYRVALDRNFPAFPIGPMDVNYIYASKLYNSEFNLRSRVNDWMTVLMGFRWIEYSELYDARSSTIAFNHTIDTNNHLYGFQLGTDLTLVGHGPLSLDCSLKAGIFHNAVDQASTATAGATFATGAQTNHTAFVGQIDLKGSYWIRENVAIQGGYQLMWFEGVALAPDQIPSTDLFGVGGGTTVDVGGSPFFHGAFAGITITR